MTPKSEIGSLPVFLNSLESNMFADFPLKIVEQEVFLTRVILWYEDLSLTDSQFSVVP